MICFNEAMKDAIVLFAILLNARTAKVRSLPYQADSNGDCLNPKAHYALDDGSNLCCSKCPPGHRLKKECTNTTDSECEPCPRGLYIESWNYSPNCFSCVKCKASKGLREAQSCSSSIKSMCVCQAGMYCIIGFDDPSCTDCKRYFHCKPGYGVSIPGKANSNVKCAPCPGGTFSDTSSFTDSCRPHTNCEGRAVVEKGNTTSDTVCEAMTLSHTVLPQSTTNEPLAIFVPTTASPVTTTTSTTLESTLSTTSLVSGAKPPIIDIKPVAVITSVIGLLLLFIIMLVLLVRCKAIQKKGKVSLQKEAERFDPKMDTNGNCERDDNTNQDYSAETQLTSFTINSPEQQCLLEAGEACCSLSQSINDAETLVRMEECSSQECESIGPLLSTIAVYNPHSALSEPMPLLTNTEPISSQPNISPQSPSQPTSPQLINPVAGGPSHVNVSITLLIGNGSLGTPPIIPTDSVQMDPDLPVGQEEECFSMPQQEAGKSSLMAVQESVSCNG